jgi:hypothetical protein
MTHNKPATSVAARVATRIECRRALSICRLRSWRQLPVLDSPVEAIARVKMRERCGAVALVYGGTEVPRSCRDSSASWNRVEMKAAAGTVELNSGAAPLHQAAKEADLAGVVHVMKGDAVDAADNFLRARAIGGVVKRRDQGAMLAFKEFSIGAPSGIRRSASFWAREKIAALERERSALSAFDFAAYHVFPVGSVESQLPNIVSSGSGTPCGLRRGDASDGLAKVWSVPGFLRIGFVDQTRKQGTAHGFSGAEQFTVCYTRRARNSTLVQLKREKDAALKAAALRLNLGGRCASRRRGESQSPHPSRSARRVRHPERQKWRRDAGATKAREILRPTRADSE